MNTLLLTKSTDVYKIVSESATPAEIIYTCQPMLWSRISYDYVEESSGIYCKVNECDVELINTNTSTIRMRKDHLLGFC